jgi:hypothetical protein
LDGLSRELDAATESVAYAMAYAFNAMSNFLEDVGFRERVAGGEEFEFPGWV